MDIHLVILPIISMLLGLYLVCLGLWEFGKCAVMGTELGINDWHCHHKNPYHLSKDDTFANLVVLHETVHRLVHLKDCEKINPLVKALKLTKKQKEKEKVSELRKQCNNEPI